MPFPLLKLLFLLVSMSALLLLLLYITLSTSLPLTARPSLFPTSAIISLAEDNSTFFLSRPAAFGPSLPKIGLTGQLLALHENQLACDDVIDGGDMTGALAESFLLEAFGNGRVTDSDRLHSSSSDKSVSSEASNTAPKDVAMKKGSRPSIKTLQESALIKGKVVLVMRGKCGFYEKVMWSQRRGAIAVIVGDDEAHRPLLTMYAKGDTTNITIPSIFTSYTTAHLLISLIPKKASSVKKGTSPIEQPINAYPTILSASSIAREAASTASRAQLQSTTKGRKEKHNAALGPHDEDGRNVKAGSIGFRGVGWIGNENGIPGFRYFRKTKVPDMREGLWITLTPTRMSSSPLVDTLLVLVVSPLVTLTVVYTMLLLRSRYRRRRWRAPKSVVDQLPVRTYHSISRAPSPVPSVHASPRLSPASFEKRSNTSTPTRRSPSRGRPVPEASASTSALPNPNASSPTLNSPSNTVVFRYFPPSTECVVCLEEYVDGVSRIMRLPCGHEFHVDCITPWLTTRRRTCPICKKCVVSGLGLDSAGVGSGRSSSLSFTSAPSEWIMIRARRLFGMRQQPRDRSRRASERTPLIDQDEDPENAP